MGEAGSINTERKLNKDKESLRPGRVETGGEMQIYKYISRRQRKVSLKKLINICIQSYVCHFWEEREKICQHCKRLEVCSSGEGDGGRERRCLVTHHMRLRSGRQRLASTGY